MKNNYTIIVGCGDLGINLATDLYLNDNDVLVIDNNEKSIKNLPSNFGGLTIVSNGTDIALSIGILVVTILFIAKVAIKIYSNAILNYGTKMSFKDIVNMYKDKK